MPDPGPLTCRDLRSEVERAQTQARPERDEEYESHIRFAAWTCGRPGPCDGCPDAAPVGRLT